MASFPGPKVHRRSRRKLSRGQVPPIPPVAVVVTSVGMVATLTFGVAVVVHGTPNLNVSGGLTLVSQVVISPTVIQQTYSDALVGKTYLLAPGDPSVSSFQGGVVAGASGTF